MAARARDKDSRSAKRSASLPPKSLVAVDPELTAVGRMLEWGAREGASSFRSTVAATQQIISWLSTQPIVLLPADAVAAKFRHEAYDSLKQSEAILLPIIPGTGLHPVLYFKYDWSRSLPELRLRAGMYTLDGGSVVRGYGFRFEAPEPGGRHEYPHTQPINTFGQGGATLTCPDWLSDKEPTFPLWGRCSADLALAMLISFYGPAVMSDLELIAGRTLHRWTSECRTWLQRFRARIFEFKHAGSSRRVVVTTWLDESTVRERAGREKLRDMRAISHSVRTSLVTAGAENVIW